MHKSQTELLHRQLMSWAKDEMTYQATSLSSSNDFQFPSEHDFKLLFQKPLDDVWKFVLKHVKSVQTVKHVKGNITVKRNMDSQKSSKPQTETDKDDNEEVAMSRRSRSKLVKELTSCLIDISYLQKELEQVSKDIMETEMSYQGTCQHVRDLQRKESIFEVVVRASDARIAQYSNCRKQFVEHMNQLKRSSDSSSDNFVMGGRSHKDGILETKADRDVRLSCEHISRFLHELFDGSLATDKEALKRAETQVWKVVEATAGQYSTKATLTSLISHVQHTTMCLKEETVKLDIGKDAQELSFTYEDDKGLLDISQPVPVEKTVKQLLDASNLRHVLRWFKEQEYRNDEWKLTARLEDIKMEIHKHVSRLVGDNPRNVQLAKGFIDALIQLAVERSVLPCIREETTRITEAIELAREEKEELHRKFEKIQDFKKIVGRKQSIIAALAKQNTTASERLLNRKMQVLSFRTSKSMDTQVSETKLLTSGLRGNLSSELEKFTTMVLPCLLVISLDSNTRLSVLDLSIAPSMFYVLHDKPWIYTDVSDAVGFPLFKSTDCLPLRLFELHNTLQDLINFQQHRDLRIQSALKDAQTTDDLDHFIAGLKKKKCAELCNTMEQFDKGQYEKCIPQLKKASEHLKSSIHKMATIKRQITSWWEQPAKYTTPWIVQEGKTFEQWMQKWRILVTEAHKQMDSRNFTKHTQR